MRRFLLLPMRCSGDSADKTDDSVNGMELSDYERSQRCIPDRNTPLALYAAL